MLDDYGFEIYEENAFPLAYLLTFRTFGSWLHGDERGSIDRHGKNIYGTLDTAPNQKLKAEMQNQMKQSEVVLNNVQRKTVEAAITEVCEHRGYLLQAVNVRTNHVHAVVAAQAKPERIIDSFKSYATRQLREENLFPREFTVWSRGKSRRYLWKPHHVALAIEYVLYGQGDLPFEIKD